MRLRTVIALLAALVLGFWLGTIWPRARPPARYSIVGRYLLDADTGQAWLLQGDTAHPVAAPRSWTVEEFYAREMPPRSLSVEEALALARAEEAARATNSLRRP